MLPVILIVLVALIALAVRAGKPIIGHAATSAMSARRSKCSDCVHMRKLFDDGTLCGFGRAEVFKNSVHVQNCLDHQK